MGVNCADMIELIPEMPTILLMALHCTTERYKIACYLVVLLPVTCQKYSTMNEMWYGTRKSPSYLKFSEIDREIHEVF